MGEWAEVVNGVVVNVVLADAEWVEGQANPEHWVEYFAANPAKIGGEYLSGVFYSPRPFPSWTRDEDGDWLPPVPYPTDIYHDWQWNEGGLKWTAVQSKS